MARATNKLAKIVAAPMVNAPSSAETMRYRAEEALHTITRAQEHMKDRQLMGEVRKVAREKAKMFHEVAHPKARR